MWRCAGLCLLFLLKQHKPCLCSLPTFVVTTSGKLSARVVTGLGLEVTKLVLGLRGGKVLERAVEHDCNMAATGGKS